MKWYLHVFPWEMLWVDGRHAEIGFLIPSFPVLWTSNQRKELFSHWWPVNVFILSKKLLWHNWTQGDYPVIIHEKALLPAILEDKHSGCRPYVCCLFRNPLANRIMHFRQDNISDIQSGLIFRNSGQCHIIIGHSNAPAGSFYTQLFYDGNNQ